VDGLDSPFVHQPPPKFPGNHASDGYSTEAYLEEFNEYAARRSCDEKEKSFLIEDWMKQGHGQLSTQNIAPIQWDLSRSSLTVLDTKGARRKSMRS